MIGYIFEFMQRGRYYTGNEKQVSAGVKSFSTVRYWLEEVYRWFTVRKDQKVKSTKVVVTFYLRLKNEFQPFPAKNQASDWLTC